MDRFETRAFPPIRNPVYIVNDDASWKRTPQPLNVLQQGPAVPRGVDPRTTSAGSIPPVAGLTPIVPFASQTPYNVWGLYPQ